jgi:hypothetical protein
MSRALIPEYPKPFLCSNGIRKPSLLDGMEENCLATEIQKLSRDVPFKDVLPSCNADSKGVRMEFKKFRNKTTCVCK